MLKIPTCRAWSCQSFSLQVETERPGGCGRVGWLWWCCRATHDDQMVHRGVDGRGGGGVSAPPFQWSQSWGSHYRLEKQPFVCECGGPRVVNFSKTHLPLAVFKARLVFVRLITPNQSVIWGSAALLFALAVLHNFQLISHRPVSARMTHGFCFFRVSSWL